MAVWQVAATLPLRGAAVNRAERTMPVMVGRRGAQTPKLNERGRPIFTRAKSAETVAWRAEAIPLLAMAMRAAGWHPSDRHAPVACDITVHVANPQQDVDSVAKQVLDAVEAAARQVTPLDPQVLLECALSKREPPGWRDSAVLDLRVRKRLAAGDPRIEVRIREMAMEEVAG